jgi:PAS domain S-box-containing protein
MKRNRLRLFVFILIAFFSLGVVCARSVYDAYGNTHEQNHLVIATANNEPISTNRLLYTAFREHRYNVDFVSPVIREGYSQANEGIVDGLTAGYPDLHLIYTNLIQIPIAIENVNVRVFAREGSELRIQTWSELDGLRVGILEGRTFILENIPPGAEKTEKPTNRAVLNGLENFEYDVVILAERDHENIGARYNVMRIGQVHSLPVHVYLHKRHADLVPELTETLRRMFEDGIAGRILSDMPLPELNPKNTIVHILSSGIELSREDQFNEALRGRFKNNMDIEWITVNIDANRFTRGQHNMAHIASLLRADIVSRNVAAVIVSGDPALEFLKDYYYLFFRNVPVLFYGISGQSHATIADHEHHHNFTGIVQRINAYEMVNVFLGLFPGTRNLFVINDFTLEGIQYHNTIAYQLRPLSPRLNISFNENVDIATLMEQVAALPSDSLILIGSYFVDGGHQYFPLNEMTRLLERNASVPIISFYYTNVAYNAVGGFAFDYRQYGYALSKMLEQLLNGESVESISVIYDSSRLNRWVFDQVQLDRFNIRVRYLPTGAEVINRLPSLREANPHLYIIMMVSIVTAGLLVIGIVIFFIINNRHNKQKDKLQQALAIEKSMLEIIFDSVPEILYVKDLDNRFLRVNKKFEEHFGCDEADIIGKKGYEYATLAGIVDDYLEMEKRIVAENRPFIVEKSIIAADGTLGFFEIIGGPLSDGDKVLGVAGVAYNITHRKQAEEAAQAASTAKSNFLTNMSHEMRTPLAAVLGLTELTLETVQLDDETHTNLVKVYRSGETLLNLINDILDISKIEADKLELNPRNYDLPSLLNDTITQSMLYIDEKPIELKLDIHEDLPNYLYGDELRIKQILSNLLSNAFKYTKEGTVELGMRCKRDNDDVWLTAWVKDTGVGIKTEDMDRLFTLYGKMEESSTKSKNRRTEGTGLGLSIARKVAELMDGGIKVESEYGKGSTFTVKVRQGYTDDTVIGQTVVDSLRKNNYAVQRFDNAKMSRINLSYARVLLVDDNPTNLDVARGLMGLYGMTIDCVTSGKLAVEAIKNPKKRYNAVFMDHMMPEMDGIEATAIIRNEDSVYAKNIPIIALTANAIVGNEEMFLSKGFQAFIAKPIDLARLDVVLRQWVRDKEAEAQLNHKVITIEIRRGKERRFLDDIPGLDVNGGIAHFGYSENAYLKVLQSYTKNTRPLLDIIKIVNPHILDVYGITVHGIKGASRGIFAEDIGDNAEALEKAALANDFDYVNANNQPFLEKLSKLLSDIDDALVQSGIANKPRKSKPDEIWIKKLLDACNQFDIDEMDVVMAAIEGYEYTDDAGLVNRLREAMDKGRYKDMKEMMKNTEVLYE